MGCCVLRVACCVLRVALRVCGEAEKIHTPVGSGISVFPVGVVNFIHVVWILIKVRFNNRYNRVLNSKRGVMLDIEQWFST